MDKKINQSENYNDEEIDLMEIFAALWRGKWWIIGITFVFAVAAVAIAVRIPNEYKATAVVQPNESSGGGKLASLAGQFGGLASLAGINLGSGESSDAVIAMEIMKSWGFAEEFIKKHELEVPLFAAEKWNQGSDALVINPQLYDEDSKKWVRNAPKGKASEPSSWKLYEKYKGILSVSQDKQTGLISISITHYSPKIAKQWVDLLVSDINAYMKKRALEESNQSIAYLEKQISTTSVAEIRSVFSQLIQEQHKTKMLAQVSKEYIFKTISEAKVPEVKVKPRRAVIVMIGCVLGFIISSLCVLLVCRVRNK